MTQSHQTNDHVEVEMDAALRTKAMEALLIEKGLITTDAIDEIVRLYEQDIGPLNGAKVVAKAWKDPAYKQRLLENGTAAVAELGFTGRQGAEIVILENTPSVHNVVVCTLCSCYPWPILGLPPNWYKSFAYRSRVVREPRTVLSEFGLEVPDEVEIRVWDSNSEVRYMVLPEQPEGTDHLGEEELVPLITRDAMIGVSKVDASSLAVGDE
jgi:nitrile hydratase subunit alpha